MSQEVTLKNHCFLRGLTDFFIEILFKYRCKQNVSKWYHKSRCEQHDIPVGTEISRHRIK